MRPVARPPIPGEIVSGRNPTRSFSGDVSLPSLVARAVTLSRAKTDGPQTCRGTGCCTDCGRSSSQGLRRNGGSHACNVFCRRPSSLALQAPLNRAGGHFLAEGQVVWIYKDFRDQRSSPSEGNQLCRVPHTPYRTRSVPRPIVGLWKAPAGRWAMDCAAVASFLVGAFSPFG